MIPCLIRATGKQGKSDGQEKKKKKISGMVILLFGAAGS